MPMSKAPGIISIILVKIMSPEGVYQYLIHKDPDSIAGILPILSTSKLQYFFDNLSLEIFFELMFLLNKEQLKFILNNIDDEKLIKIISKISKEHLKDIVSYIHLEKKKDLINKFTLKRRVLIMSHLLYNELEYIIPSLDIDTINDFLNNSPLHNLTAYFNLLTTDQKAKILNVLHERILAHIVPRWDDESERSELLRKLEKDKLTDLFFHISPITTHKIMSAWEKEFVFSILIDMHKENVTRVIVQFPEDFIAEFLDAIDSRSKVEIINTFSHAKAYSVLKGMSIDDRQDIINELEPSLRLTLRSKLL